MSFFRVLVFHLWMSWERYVCHGPDTQSGRSKCEISQPMTEYSWLLLPSQALLSSKAIVQCVQWDERLCLLGGRMLVGGEIREAKPRSSGKWRSGKHGQSGVLKRVMEEGALGFRQAMDSHRIKSWEADLSVDGTGRDVLQKRVMRACWKGGLSGVRGSVSDSPRGAGFWWVQSS